MNSKHMMAMACVVALCGSVLADDFVSADFSLAWDSKYLTYGLVDNPDPILTPAGSLTFLDWLVLGVSAVMDTTKYGIGAGRMEHLRFPVAFRLCRLFGLPLRPAHP